jgi:hypothetical protein
MWCRVKFSCRSGLNTPRSGGVCCAVLCCAVLCCAVLCCAVTLCPGCWGPAACCCAQAGPLLTHLCPLYPKQHCCTPPAAAPPCLLACHAACCQGFIHNPARPPGCRHPMWPDPETTNATEIARALATPTEKFAFMPPWCVPRRFARRFLGFRGQAVQAIGIQVILGHPFFSPCILQLGNNRFPLKTANTSATLVVSCWPTHMFNTRCRLNLPGYLPWVSGF